MKLRKCMVMVLAAICFAIPANAAETDFPYDLAERSGAAALYDRLDENTQELVDQVQGSEPLSLGDGKGILQAAIEVLRRKITGPVRALAAITAVIVLFRMGTSLGETSVEKTASLAVNLSCGLLMGVPLLDLMHATSRVVERTGAFLVAAVPVYAALLAASGNPTVSGSYSFMTLAAGNGIPLFCSAVVFPLLHVLLAMAFVTGVCDIRMEKLTNTVYGAAKWLLVVAVSVFSGVLSLQTVLNARIDVASSKAAKILAASAVPVIGSALGDAVSAVKNSVELVKSGVGAFGLLSALCLLLPAVLETTLWIAVCQVGQIIGDLFEANRAAGFLAACGNVARMLLAILVSTGVVAVVSAALVISVHNAL